MSVSKHTPGKWQWDEPENWLGLSARVFVREPYGMIAQVQISGWKPKSMAIANAKLIAAAPDLLAACEEVHRSLTSPSRELLDSTRRELEPWLPMITAAIAKATT
jgi:hypothetical protein